MQLAAAHPLRRLMTPGAQATAGVPEPARSVLEEQAAFQLGKRSVAGALAQLVLLLTLVIAVEPYVGSPPLFVVLSAIVFAFNLLRLTLALCQARFFPQHAPTWNTLFTASVLVPGLAWGGLLHVMFRVAGALSFPALVSIIIVSGTCAGMTTSVSPRQNLARVFNTFVLGIAVPELLQRPSRETVTLAALAVAYYVFLWFVLAIQSADYWDGLVTRERLAQERNRLRSFLDTIPGLASWVGPDLRFRGVNERYAQNYGGHAEDFPGRAIGFRNDDRAFVAAVTDFVLSPSEQAAVEVPLSVHGRARWHLLVMRKISSEPGARAGVEAFLIGIDIHDRVALAKAEQELAARDDFISVASHELNTPLTSLRLTLGMLEDTCRRTPVGEKAQSLVSRALRQTVRLSELVAALLEITRIRGGRVALDREEMDLCELVRQVTARFALDLDRTGSRLVLDLRAPVVGFWDRSRLDQVVSNLLSNAIKFGEGRPIEVRARSADGRAELVVRDHGIGIPPDRLPYVFDRFERAVAREHYGGLGLGLFIVRQLVELHAGTVRVESAPGRGSTFTVELPRGGDEGAA